jgi:hypothetical protein
VSKSGLLSPKTRLIYLKLITFPRKSFFDEISHVKMSLDMEKSSPETETTRKLFLCRLRQHGNLKISNISTLVPFFSHKTHVPSLSEQKSSVYAKKL